MKFKMNVTVTGAKFFNDSIEGKHYDTTTIFVLLDLDESQGRAKGLAAAEYRFPSSSLFESIKNLPFPHEAELILNQVTSGKVVKTTLEGHRMLPSVNRQTGEVAKV
ncbi:hypothetical protein [Janthinobacterium sp. B9-8]|uniref:hypothetical protein n=1 Tax=Janthinobacterium sp. B9-8 TaxID=1236179 RepID=UPI00061D1C8A|nr:hypothetical protein [Janthinobacterium sp. B9-8]AMC34211.1 hypothetical protein VN23_06190 [Janthinobacterium sp. B9-8]